MLGFWDFLANKPTIVGSFYKEHTTVGLKLSGEWERIREKIKKLKS